jgi:hypothetical protein
MAARALLSLLCAPLLGLLLTVSGCSGRDPASPESRAVADRRIHGEWLLVSFKPESALEPVLASLLAAQAGVMTLSFDSGTLIAQGVGVSARRAYQIVEADDHHLKGVLRDEQGVAYNVEAWFRANELDFASLDAPWRGQGLLRRR